MRHMFSTASNGHPKQEFRDQIIPQIPGSFKDVVVCQFSILDAGSTGSTGSYMFTTCQMGWFDLETTSETTLENDF